MMITGLVFWNNNGVFRIRRVCAQPLSFFRSMLYYSFDYFKLLFQLQEEFIYLTNDDNRVIIPDEQGRFPSDELFNSHYKVSGSSYTPRDSTLSGTPTFSTSGAGICIIFRH